MSETTAQNKVFIYEPHLVANLAELIHPDKGIPNVCLLFHIKMGGSGSYDALQMMQVYALCALDGVARHRGKLSEVLTALNASANHGVLLQVLRKVTQESNGKCS